MSSLVRNAGVAALALLVFAGTGTATDSAPVPVVPEPQGSYVQRQMLMLFGPLKQRRSLITGVDLEGLLEKLEGPGTTTQRGEVTWEGVQYKLYQPGVPVVASPRQITAMLSLGVYESPEAAQRALGLVLNRMSMPLRPFHEFGDRAFHEQYVLLVTVNNAMLAVRSLQSDDTVLRLGRALARQLEAASGFVTLGRTVTLPQVLETGLPETLTVGQRVSATPKLSGDGPSPLLLCLDDFNPSPLAVRRTGTGPAMLEVHSAAPVDKVVTLWVATARNVMASKEVRIRVAGGPPAQ
ncbi:MAG TPA: hypothetical protein VGN26_22500 [Armatimonadota bacterium]|jgi:hypothetical protein